jgi:hypothetical protein
VSIPLFVAALILFNAPVLTHEVFQLIHDKEMAVIAMDNAAIKVGQLDRSNFNKLMGTNRLISSLEKLHHVFHAIALSKTASPQAVLQDRIMEREILFLHGSIKKVADYFWGQGALVVERELGKFKVPLIDFSRKKIVPLHEVKCPICRLAVFWEVDRGQTQTVLHVYSKDWRRGIRIQPKGTSLMGGSKWNYQLFAD